MTSIIPPKKRRLSASSPGEEEGRRVLVNESSKKVKSESANLSGTGATTSITSGSNTKTESPATSPPSNLSPPQAPKTPPHRTNMNTSTSSVPSLDAASASTSPSRSRQQHPLLSQQTLSACAHPDLLIRLTKKEEEVQSLLSELQTLLQTLTPDYSFDPSLRKKFLDPAINALFRTMKKELVDKEKAIEDLHRELDGIMFTPNSITGKKLVTKLRTLQLENEELGRQLRQGRVEQYEVEIALQRKIIEELKSGLEESDSQLVIMDEENERLQDIIFQLRAKLKQYEEKFGDLQSAKKNFSINNDNGGGTSSNTATVTPYPNSIAFTPIPESPEGEEDDDVQKTGGEDDQGDDISNSNNINTETQTERLQHETNEDKKRTKNIIEL